METKIHQFDLIRRYLNQAVKSVIFTKTTRTEKHDSDII